MAARKRYKRNRKDMLAQNRTRTHKKRAYLTAYLEEHPCVDCGEEDTKVLEFDHVKKGKLFTISRGYRRYGMKKIKAEVKKCVVRCANCHKRKTAHVENSYRVVKGSTSFLTLAQKKVIRYLRAHPCTDCGEDDITVLEFDHVRGERQFCIGGVVSHAKWEDVEREIKKCEVRCRNCHKLRHKELFKRKEE
jgi:hypothetical protein